MKIMKEILRKIKKADTITIFGHVRPDGDCYGSQIGLRDAIRATYPKKKVYAIGRGRPDLQFYFGYMDEVDDETIKKSLAITVDIGDLPRLEDPRCLTAADLIKIDHHIFTDHFGSLEWVDTEYVASGEMVADFLFENHFKISKSSAKALFFAIASDSGRFQYAPTNARTFMIASLLNSLGADTEEIFQTVYVFEPEEVRRKHKVMVDFKTRGGVAYLSLNKDDLARLAVTSSQVGGYVNGLANMKGYPVWALFVEKPEGEINCELRSAGPNIQVVAAEFGGGGHRKASGARLKSWDQVELMLKRLEEVALIEPIIEETE